jgi:hypothetical protein
MQSKMNIPVDYTPVLLAQLTDLQMRVTKQESIISALQAEVEKLSGHTLNVSHTMKTSIPLRSHDSYTSQTRTPTRAPRTDTHHKTDTPRSRPKVAKNDVPPKSSHPVMSLSDVLNKDETVTIQVGTGKDAEGNFTYTYAVASFDGTELIVNECELAKSIVGMKSSKPGEILYKFIDELKTAGHIKKTFTIAPWRLCFVERGGIKKSLEELRNVVG